MLYALAHNLDRCFILFVNKSNLYQMKLVEFPVDYKYAEGLLQKAKAINEAVDAGVPPEKLNAPDECPQCPYRSFCLPEYSTGGNLKISDSDELQGVLDRLGELADAKKEISELEKVRDSLLVKGQDTVAGRWLITWTHSVYEKKATEAQQIETWRKKIIIFS